MKHSLLVIDDDLGTRSFLKFMLQNKFDVKACVDGYEAVQWLESGNFPDMIISDMLMPRLDGLNLIKFVRSSGFFRAIPIIILSGLDDDDIKNKAYKEGVDLYLCKPFGPTKLVDQIVNLLTTSHHAKLKRSREYVSR